MCTVMFSDRPVDHRRLPTRRYVALSVHTKRLKETMKYIDHHKAELVQCTPGGKMDRWQTPDFEKLISPFLKRGDKCLVEMNKIVARDHISVDVKEWKPPSEWLTSYKDWFQITGTDITRVCLNQLECP